MLGLSISPSHIPSIRFGWSYAVIRACLMLCKVFSALI